MVVCRLRSAEIKSSTFFRLFFTLKEKGIWMCFAISLKMISLMWQTNAHTFKDILFERLGRKKKTTALTTELTHRCLAMLRYTTLGHSAGGGQSAAGGGIFPPLETVDFLILGYCRGSLNSQFGGDQRMQKSVVILRNFPLIVHCLGWECNDPCTVTGEFLNQFGS